MTWRKSPQSLIDRFDALLPDDARIERRKMFGYPAAFLDGLLFAGLHQEHLILRLSEADRAVLIDRHGATAFEPMPGRPMREYIALEEGRLADVSQARQWVARAIRHVATMPPKPPRPASAARGLKRAGSKSRTPAARGRR